MDGPDLGSRGAPGAASPLEAARPLQVDDVDEAAWRQFLQAATPPAFYEAWLALQCRMVRGVATGVLVLGSADTGYAPAAFWPSGRRHVKHLAEVAEHALVERRAIIVRHDAAGGAGVGSRERAHIASPVTIASAIRGVVALEVAARPEPQLQAALRQLQWGAAWLEVAFRRDENVHDVAVKKRLQTALDLLAVALGEERFAAAATAFVTALATHLDCDRVSVGFVRGGRVRVRAVSHTAEFGKQTNLIRAIGLAMDEAFDQQAAVVHPPLSGRPVQVSRAHEELARQQGGEAVCSIPLVTGTRVVGVLTLERPLDRPFEPTAVALGETVAALAGPALEIRRQDDRWLAAKAVDSLRSGLANVIGPRHIAVKLWLTAAVAVVLFFAFARGQYRITAHTVIEAAVQRTVAAPFKGYIGEAPARAGDVVREGQVLATLDDRELRLERLKAASQQEQLTRQFQQAMATREAAQARILTAQIEQTRAQLALLDEELARTRVTAPFDGVIVIGDLSQSLGAPVDTGQQLFLVAPLEAYRVILETDERDIANVRVGQRGQLLLSAFPGEPLPVEVRKVTPVSIAREGRNYFRVEAALEHPSERMRPGMAGAGKIDVDRRLLIWIWTHEVLDWVRLKLWAWLP